MKREWIAKDIDLGIILIGGLIRAVEEADDKACLDSARDLARLFVGTLDTLEEDMRYDAQMKNVRIRNGGQA
jgi:hypothetical protein